MTGKLIACVISIAAGATMACARTPDFRGLECLPGHSYSYAKGISADGSAVVGYSQDSSRSVVQAFLWTVEDGMVDLGPPPSGINSTAFGCSGDGSVVVGYTSSMYYPVEAFRWSEATGMVGLGGYPEDQLFTRAEDVSHDGSVIVGLDRGASSQAFRWTEQTGFVGLGFLPGTNHWGSKGYGVSADGSVVVGSSTNYSSDGQRAFRWTEEAGMAALGDLPGGESASNAKRVSANGATVVGIAHSAESGANTEAFRWTEETGMTGLGDLPTGIFASDAYDVSADGSIVVGYGYTGTNGFNQKVAFIWDANHGMRNLRDVLIDEYGLDLSDWPVLECATSISDDGLVIAGGAGNYGKAWIAVLPEPATLSLLAVGAIALIRRRKK